MSDVRCQKKPASDIRHLTSALALYLYTRGGGNDLAVAHLDDAAAHGGGLRVVRDHDDGLVEAVVHLLKHVQDDGRVLAVEVAGRLVGEDDGGLRDDGAGEWGSLLLAAGKLQRLGVHLVFELEHAEDFASAFGVAAAVFAAAVYAFGELEVAFGGEGREEVEALEVEADFASADVGAARVRGGCAVFVVHDDASASRGEQAAEEVQHRRLAAARSPHDGDELALLHVQRDAAQRRHVHAPDPVDLREILRFKNDSH